MTSTTLPREDGQIITDARFGGEQHVVEIIWNTDADGQWVREDDYSNRTFHGPFTNLAEAQEWMEAYPDDKDVKDMEAILVNAVRPA